MKEGGSSHNNILLKWKFAIIKSTLSDCSLDALRCCIVQAVYQFNAEKLEYNHLVLIERDHENYITANQQKRKLNKQRDTLSTLKGRHADLEKRFFDQNSKLADDFARVTKLLQDLQNQEHGLLQSHANVRRNFFCMHRRALTLLVSKVLQVSYRPLPSPFLLPPGGFWTT